jgi:hypothetical protein
MTAVRCVFTVVIGLKTQKAFERILVAGPQAASFSTAAFASGNDTL